MANGWTPERRARQAELIRTWKPWERSSGPKTLEGKGRSAMRGFKGGHRNLLKALKQALREQRKSHSDLHFSVGGTGAAGKPGC